MSPGNNERRNGNPPKSKSKVRNNFNVPQEAVTPTRRDINAANLGATPLDWVPVSEYNLRNNYNTHSLNSRQRKTTNGSATDNDFSDLESQAFDCSFGRFVPVRPQPRAASHSSMQQGERSGQSNEHLDESQQAGPSNVYSQQPPNGVNPHSNHPPAAIMIVNPTTPNTSMAVAQQQPISSNQAPMNTSRSNVARSNSGRVSGDGAPNIHSDPTFTMPPGVAHSGGPKPNNFVNNAYDGTNQGDLNAQNSADAVRAMVAACPESIQVERRLGQIREYIRVTSSLVDTMRNSEDEAYIEHTKGEYDELVEMVMKLKESETSLMKMLEISPSEIEVSEIDLSNAAVKDVESDTSQNTVVEIAQESEKSECNETVSEDVPEVVLDETCNRIDHFLMKVKSIEKSIKELDKTVDETKAKAQKDKTVLENILEQMNIPSLGDLNNNLALSSLNEEDAQSVKNQVIEQQQEVEDLNTALQKNISSCNEKLALISTLKESNVSENRESKKEMVVRPVSVQSNVSAYSDNELWQNELKAKVEMSQQRIAALQEQQKRLLKYQVAAKQQLADIHRFRIDEENLQDTINFQTQQNDQHSLRGPPSQIGGIVSTLPRSNESSIHHNSGRVSSAGPAEDIQNHRGNSQNQDPVNPNWSAMPMAERARTLQNELSELQQKKQHMESLVSEFQRLQTEASSWSEHNTYQSSDEDSVPDNNTQCNNKRDENIDNGDPFKLMEISAIKAAIDKAKDLMRTVQRYENNEQENTMRESYNIPTTSNRIESARCENNSMSRLQNYIGNKMNNRCERSGTSPSSSSRRNTHATNLNLAQAKKVNERNRSPGPLERKQMALKAELDEKQRQLTALINKEKEICSAMVNTSQESQRVTMNETYNSDPDEGEELASSSRVELTPSEHQQHQMHYQQNSVANAFNDMHIQPGPSYMSDGESSARMKSCEKMLRNRRNRTISSSNRPASVNNCSEEPQDGSVADQNESSQLHNSGFPPNIVIPYQQQSVPHPPPWCKSNQDLRPNQFTQNSHSQTMEQQQNMMGSPPQVPFHAPPFSYPIMMPYGGGGCPGCSSAWWCWQQLMSQQREIQQLKLAISQLSERWPEEPTLNNRVAPGTRANNYWDNFRSYSRQNLLSSSSKWNADGHLGTQPNSPHPLVDRSHNPLHSNEQVTRTPPNNTPKRNTAHTNTTNANPFTESMSKRRRNISPDSVNTVVSAPDVLNLNHNTEPENVPEQVNVETQTNLNQTNVNLNREPQRNLSITNSIPELIQSHSNNLNTTANKMKSSSKLPAKNTAIRRNCTLDYVTNRNIDIASTSAIPNPNLASASSDTSEDKSTSKLFDLLRENIYSEVTALISANEAHPDFLIQLFRDLQQVSSDSLRQHTLASVRDILNQVSARSEPIQQASERSETQLGNRSPQVLGIISFLMSRSDEVCTQEFIRSLKTIMSSLYEMADSNLYSTRRLNDILSKYEGARLCDVSDGIIHDLLEITNSDDLGRGSELSESSIMQDVVGSMNIFSSSDVNLNYQEQWSQPEPSCSRTTTFNESKVDLIECAEVVNGDLAEADQTCPSESAADISMVASEDIIEGLPDVIENEEIAPSEAEAEWLGLDRVPTRLHMDNPPANQKD